MTSARDRLLEPATVADRIERHETRAIGRALSWLEAGDVRGGAVLATLRARRPVEADAWRVGVTGAPGSGKSTLVDRLVQAWRARGERVAVVAVDPSSPFSGGALLGDRIRMTRWHADPDVFVRSMATRGRLGGLADAALRAAALLEVAGFERVVLETVGVGQSEVDVAAAADTTLVVLTPGGGDDVQAVKAGVMEIADLLLVNKADLAGAERLRRALVEAQTLIPLDADAWTPPVLVARAEAGEGIGTVVSEIDLHRSWRSSREDADARSRRRARAELTAAVHAHAAGWTHDQAEPWLRALTRGEVTADEAAVRLLALFEGPDGATATDATDSEVASES